MVHAQTGGSGGQGYAQLPQQQSSSVAPVVEAIYALRSVEMANFDFCPPLKMIRVIAITPSDNWDRPFLATTAPVGSDHILDLTFVASATGFPANPFPRMPKMHELQAFMVVDSSYGQVDGVRVRSATNVLAVNGQAPTKQVPEPSMVGLTDLIGKTLIPDTKPCVASADKHAIRQCELGVRVRVVLPTAPALDNSLQANRLTVFLDGAGQIRTAVWE
jgi:hypothetical protein